jgi:hypothetical protein
LLKRVGDRGAFGDNGPVAIVMGAVIAVLPGAGATIALNATRKR